MQLPRDKKGKRKKPKPNLEVQLHCQISAAKPKPMWLIPKAWERGTSFACRPGGHVCSSWRFTFTSASLISYHPLNCYDFPLPRQRTIKNRCSSKAQKLNYIFLSKHMLAGKENHSLTQEVRWYHRLQWNTALLKCLPETQAFDFILHDACRPVFECYRHCKLQSAILLPELTKKGTCI